MSVRDRSGDEWPPREPVDEDQPQASDLMAPSNSALMRFIGDLQRRVAQLEAEVIELQSSVVDLRAGRG